MQAGRIVRSGKRSARPLLNVFPIRMFRALRSIRLGAVTQNGYCDGGLIKEEGRLGKKAELSYRVKLQ
jgi:hypothetical protein